MKKIFNLLMLCLGIFALASCGKDDVDNGGNSPTPSDVAISYKSCNDEMRISSIESTLDIEFTATAAWSAKSSNVAWLSIEQGKSGKKGTNQMRLRYKANKTSSEREGTITVSVEGFEPVILVTLTQGVAGDHADFDVNASKTDQILSKYYLWNDEYNELMRDYAQDYRSFLSNTLLSMTTNEDDGGREEDGSRYLYSYIIRSTTGRAPVAKSAEDSFGINSLIIVSLTNSNGSASGKYAFAVRAVHPDSPADEAGLRRGDMITKVNGKDITSSNYTDFYYDLLIPSAGNQITVKTMNGTESISMTAKRIYINPVLHSEVVTAGASKIGYLVYSQFEASFDNELLAVLRNFKNEGINELILDFRLNGGGHVMTSQMISSIVAGTKGDDKIYQKYRYNDTRMAEMNLSFPDRTKVEKFGPEHGGSDYSRSDYLSLERVFFLVTNNTASSSEFTFHALRGIDFPVTLIGERTEGKNVGMEPQSFQYGDYYYEFLPITFQGYNAKNDSPNPNGTEPDYHAEDWDPSMGLHDWGDTSDALYGKALEIITGSRVATNEVAPREVNFRLERYMPKPSIGAIARNAEELPTCGE